MSETPVFPPSRFNVVSEVLRSLQDRFECQQCGKCCRVGGNPLLTDEDVKRLAIHLNCSPWDKERIPIEPCEVAGYDYRVVHTSPCFFLGKMTDWCLVQSVKPENCREWPFISLAKGLCDLEHVLVCPEATRLLNEFFGVCRPSKCDSLMRDEFTEGWHAHIEEVGD